MPQFPSPKNDSNFNVSNPLKILFILNQTKTQIKQAPLRDTVHKCVYETFDKNDLNWQKSLCNIKKRMMKHNND